VDYVSVQVSDIDGVERKPAGIVVHTSQGDFRFGGMRDAGGWVDAIDAARMDHGSQPG
jgi:hypothetical protein